MKNIPFYLLILLTGCTARVAGTGINVQDPAHLVSVQANSFNAEISTNEDYR